MSNLISLGLLGVKKNEVTDVFLLVVNELVL